MTVYLTVVRGTITSRYRARIETAAGRTIAQALDIVEHKAISRAKRQATNWARDHGWDSLIIKRREVSA